MNSLISPKPGEVKRLKNREVMRAKNNSQIIPFRQQLRKCLEFNPNITLATIEAKLKLKYPRQDVISGTLLQYGEPVSQFANYSEKIWSSGFHPDYGFCHTFNLGNINMIYFYFRRTT